VDRFTRDETSAKVWWPFAMLLVVVFVLSFWGQNRAVDQAREEGATDAAALVIAAVHPIVTNADLTRPLSKPTDDAVTEVVTDDLLTEDARITAVRLWASDGTLLYTTDADGSLGSKAALNDEALQEASGSPGRVVLVRTSTTPTGEPADPRVRAYATLPASASAIAEVELDEELLLDGVRGTWSTAQIVTAIAGLLVLGLALLSMRQPLAPMGVGVPFYPTSVPSGMAVLDVDEANELREAGAYARGRIQSQKVRLDELEASKLRLEGELQRALSTGAMTTVARSIPRGATETEPPAPAGMPGPAPAPVVPVARIPDRAAPAAVGPAKATRETKRRETAPIEATAPTPAPIEPAAPTPRSVQPAASAGGKTERPVEAPAPFAARAPKPGAAEPAASATPKPAAPAPKPAASASKPSAPAPKPSAPAPKPAASAPKPAATAPKPAASAPPPPRPSRDEVPPVPTPSPRVAAAAPAHEDDAFVVVPESERIVPPPSRPASVVRVPDADDEGRHDAEVLDVLERLVEPIGTPVPEADPGAMRARLARTAARKKPGSRSDERFHDPDEPPAR
jgi:hypothetical protein